MAEMLPVKKADSIVDELEKMYERVMRRAYELFELSGCTNGHDLDDWLMAERELVWAPPIELEEGDQEVTVKMSAPGVDPKDIAVEVTSDDLLVEAETRHEQRKGKGKARSSEITSAKLFRAVHFPRRIDPESARAELKNGTLKLTARIAEESSAHKVEIVAA